MTTVKFKGAPKIYLNSLVENAEAYFSAQTKPIEAEILDAWFEKKGETQIVVIEGLCDYYDNKKFLNLNTPEEKYIHEQYSGITLNFVVREKHTSKISFLKMDSIEDILNQIREHESKDSCMPLINKPLNIYRQSVNGRDVIGFSKVYPSTTSVSLNKN